MLNFRFLANIAIILFLVLLQVFVFSNLSINGMIAPYIYIIFILVYPPQNNRYVLLFLSFLLGLGVDIFEQTGGINAFASTTIALLSGFFIRFISGTKFFEVEDFKFSDYSPIQWFVYVLIMVFIHHFLLFALESFSFDNFGQMMLKVLYTTLFTSVLIYFYLILFRKRAER